MALLTSITILFQSFIILYASYKFNIYIKKKKEIEQYTKTFPCFMINGNSEQSVREAYAQYRYIGLARLIEMYKFKEYILFGRTFHYYLCEDLSQKNQRDSTNSTQREFTDEELIKMERYEELAERKKRRGY